MKLEDITENDIWDIADSRAILARGLNYYETGQIASMDFSGDKITAKVKGSYGRYDVEITVEDGTLQADCDCPYDGYGCKHIVAVLHKWINKKGGMKHVKGKKTTRREFDIDKELSRLGKDELKTILLNLYDNREDVRSDILLGMGGNADVADAGKDIVLGQIKNAFRVRCGYIDYYAVHDVVKWLETTKETILGAPPDTRTPLLKALARESLDVIDSCDDSDGSMGSFIIDCLTDLGRSIHEQNLPFGEKKRIIQEYLDLLDDEEYGLEDGYINLVLEVPSTREDFTLLIDELKSRMEAYKGGYEEDMYRDMLMDAYRKAGDDDEYLALLEEGAGEKGDYLPLVQFWKEKGDLKKAIGIAEDAINNREERLVQNAALLEFLEGVYRSNKDWKDLLRISILYFKRAPSLKKYKDVKEIAEKLHRWDSVKPELIKAVSGIESVKIHLFEKEYDKAFQKVTGAESFSDRLKDEVAKALATKEPGKALDIYLPLVQEFIGYKTREGYGVAALYAKKVKNIYLKEGRGDEWKRYVVGIRTENKRRPALIDEFRRL